MLKLYRITAVCLMLSASFSFAENGSERGAGTDVASISPDAHAYKPAPQPKTKIYKFVENGTTSFSDTAPAKGHYVVWSTYCYACNPHSNIDWNATKLHLDEFTDTIKYSAQQFAVDPALVRAVIHAESGFNIKARSRKGAIGLMQLMPSTAREVGVKDARNPEHNIRGGVKYLATLLTQYKGNVKLATAAYNAGPAAVDKYGGVPPYAETRAYVERVGILHKRYKSSVE
jgi:membrane-bound lytic murein transglycosylase B